MLCPVCRHDNFRGEDYCEHCGADLVGQDVPEAAVDFGGRLLGEHLDALGVRAPLVVEPGTPVATALGLMRAEGRDNLLVVVGGRIAGIFTERDGVLKLAGRPDSGLAVAEVMTPDPVVLRHDDTLGVAINKMAIGGFRHIPIVDGHTPVAVVAASDIFRHILELVG